MVDQHLFEFAIAQEQQAHRATFKQSREDRDHFLLLLAERQTAAGDEHWRAGENRLFGGAERFERARPDRGGIEEIVDRAEQCLAHPHRFKLDRNLAADGDDAVGAIVESRDDQPLADHAQRSADIGVVKFRPVDAQQALAAAVRQDVDVIRAFEMADRQRRAKRMLDRRQAAHAAGEIGKPVEPRAAASDGQVDHRLRGFERLAVGEVEHRIADVEPGRQQLVVIVKHPLCTAKGQVGDQHQDLRFGHGRPFRVDWR